jgi:hypothetical protein
MNTDKMFEIAARCKFRFPYRGSVSTEDLWDLSVEHLDAIFKTLNSQVKQANEESLLAVKSKEDETLNTMIEIVKYIVSVKLTEENARLQARERREKKQRIMEIVASKQDADLQAKSVEELKAMLNDLGE